MKLEHANITVPSIEKAMRFLKTAFPEFAVRGEGESGEGKNRRRWLHFGTDATYLALEEITEPPPAHPQQKYYDLGFNHLCFEAEKIDEIHARLVQAGYPATPAPKEQFRKRYYVHDLLGNEWEFVEYFSKNPAEKNLYEKIA